MMFGVEALTGRTDFATAYSKWIALANSEAWKSNHHYKMSAIIYRGSTLFSVGHNETGSPKGDEYNSVHAEKAAIRAHRGSCQGLKMLVYRFSRKDNTIVASKPCDACTELIISNGIKQVLCVNDKQELIKMRFG